MTKSFLGLAALILSLWCAQSGHAAGPDLPRMKTIFVFGDSLSDGLLLKRTQAYPALLLDKLRDAGLKVAVVTNQSAVGRGIFDLNRLEEIGRREQNP